MQSASTPRWALFALFAGAGCAAALPEPASAAPPAATVAPASPNAAVRAVGCVGMTVSDVDRSAKFYREVLSFDKAADVEVAGAPYEALTGVFGARMRTVRMKLGAECIDLTEYLAPRGRPIPADARSNDRSFQHIAVVVRDMDRAFDVLRQNRVEYASTGPQRLPDWNPNAGGIRAFYFKDPDRHTLEIIHFPDGKGDPRWKSAPADKLFLGIDHTAIVVSDTDASLRFYAGALGMRVAGTSENWGTEQEHLNNVFGARLRITTLRAASGPGIELLEYLTPRDGRPMPADERANDLVHWQTTVTTGDLDGGARRLREAKAAFVSPGVIDVPAGGLGARRATLVRDPDGHVIDLSDR